MLQRTYLLSTSRGIGRVALAGGCLIFILWAAPRYFAALDFEDMKIVGFFWIAGFFWLCLLALLMLGVYIFINRRSLHREMWHTAGIILLNIPVALTLLILHQKISELVFIKLTNESGIEQARFRLEGGTSPCDIGALGNGDSRIFNYQPVLPNDKNLSYHQPAPVYLLMEHGGLTDTILFPGFNAGNCAHLSLDGELKIIRN